MKKNKLIISGITSLALVAVSAMADTTTATTAPQSTADAKAVAPGIMDKITLGTSHLFIGGPVTDPLTSRLPNPNTGALSAEDNDGNIFVRNTIKAGYKLAPTIKTDVLVVGDVMPAGGEKDYAIYDPSLRLSKSDLLKSGNLNIAGIARVTPGVTKASIDARKVMTARLDQSVSYQLGASRFSLGTDLYQAVNMYQGSLKDTAVRLRTYFGPNVNMQISDTVSAFMLYEIMPQALANGTWSIYAQDFEPGVSWDITPKFNLTGFLDLKTGGRIAADTTTMGLLLNASIL